MTQQNHRPQNVDRKRKPQAQAQKLEEMTSYQPRAVACTGSQLLHAQGLFCPAQAVKVPTTSKASKNFLFILVPLLS